MTTIESPPQEPAQTSYDVVPYASKAFPQTHPNRLATLARLFGMNPAPVEQARVLELGCAGGGNILAMAMHLPEGRFVGVDLSRRQVEEGRRVVQELGLKNVDLRHASILDVDESWGRFDYIVCHGVYSWVPRDVQNKILEIFRDRLTDHGVGYVSYNVYPGWHMRGMIRDMMCFHARRFNDPQKRVEQARAMLDFLVQSVNNESEPYALHLKHELELIKNSSDSYIFHEHLEEVNDPVYFHQFAERLDKKSLQYLSEAEFSTMAASNFGAETAATLAKLAPDIVLMEQYMDFLRNRMFRQTLVCRAGLPLRRNLTGRDVTGFYVDSFLKPTAPPNYDDDSPSTFQSPLGTTIEVTRPIVKAALSYLGEQFPRPVGFDELLRETRKLNKLDENRDPRFLETELNEVAGALLICYRSRLCDFHSYVPAMTMEVADKPAVTPLVRLQARRGNYSTNFRHEGAMLNTFERQLVQYLDGTRDRPALVEQMCELVRQNVLRVEQNGAAVADQSLIRTAMEQAVEAALPTFARKGLLAR